MVPSAEVRNAPTQPYRIPVGDLLSVSDLNRVLEERGWVSYGPLKGQVPSIHYNSILYRRIGTRRFVALQAWGFDQPTRAIQRWNELYATYPNAQELKDRFAPMLFFSARNEIHKMVMLHPHRNMVLSMSCSVSGCNQAQLLNLSETVYRRLNP